jgi:hypothetical protein
MNYLLQFLQVGQIAKVVNDTLYIHGALNALNMGYVPPYGRKDEQRVASLQDWVREINEFASYEIQDFIARGKQYMIEHPLDYWSKEGGYHHPQPGSRLIHYGMGTFKDKSPNPSVIYSNWFEAGRPAPMTATIARWLNENGINR